MWRTRILPGIVGCLLFLMASPGFSQVVSATLYGTVVDPNQAVIPSAKVSIKNEGTGQSLSTETAGTGEFTFVSVPAGTYTITVEASGFKTRVQSGLELRAGQQQRLTFALEIGQVTETIEVTGQAPLINTANAEQRSALDSLEVKDLPTTKRDWTSLLGLTPGIDSGSSNVRLNGLPGASFRLTVDGTDATQDTEQPSFAMSGGFNFIRGVSTEAVAEVSVAKGIASAEIANTMSGNVNITTKSGTNQFHGSAFLLNNVENFNARSQTLSNKPGLVYNQFGGSLGGPIVKDKAFFFGVYEGYRLAGFSALSDDVPTPEFKAMMHDANPIYDKALSVFPDPNQPYDAGAVTGRWVGSGTAQSRDNYALARGDYYITDRTILSTRYTRSRPFQLNPRVVTANNRTYEGKIEQGSVNVTHIRPSVTFETRFGVNYNFVPRLDHYYSLFEGDTAYNGIGGLGFGVDGETNTREGWSWSIEESIGKTIGRHSMKFGGILLHTVGSRDNIQTPNLTYSSVQDLINNIPNRGQVTMGVREYRAYTSTIGFFFQDDFKVNQKLVLNLGMRYDYFTVPKERDGRLFNRAQPFGTGPAVSPDQIWEPAHANFSPRFGFAYTVDESAKTVVRGGFGVFYNPRPLYGGPVDIVGNAIDEPFRIEYGRQDAIAQPAYQWPVSNDTVRALVKGKSTLQGGTAINTYFPYPFSYQWNLGIQREIARNLVLDTAYVGTRGKNLMMVRFWNQVDRVTGVRPYPGFTEFRYRDAGESSFYSAWQTSLRKRFANGFALGANYTYGYEYSYTNDSDLLLPTSVQDIYNVRADKAPPDSFVRHQFNFNWVYELPFARLADTNSLMARNLFAGWQISGIFRAQTGQPVNVTQSSGLQGSRADYVSGDPTLSDYTDTLQYINKSAFARVPIGDVSGVPLHPGTVGRNAFFGPGLWNLDTSLSKRFFITEAINVKFEAQMLNAFNHTNLSNLQGNVTSGSFGRLNGTRGARVIQFNLRLEF